MKFIYAYKNLYVNTIIPYYYTFFHYIIFIYIYVYLFTYIMYISLLLKNQ